MIPVLSWDYCYLCSRGPAGGDAAAAEEAAEQAGSNPVLVRWDRRGKGIAAYVLPAKGIDFGAAELVVNLLAKEVDALGYRRVCFRSDNEPALLALLRAVQQRVTCEVVTETSTEGDPRTNGAAESGVRLIKGLIRTLKDALETRLGKTLPDSHGLITWLVRYASAVYSRYTVGRDGRTPYERLTGRRFRGAVAEFGEAVWWMPIQPQGRLPPLGARFESGWYLGPVDGQAQSYIMTETGVVRTRTIRRRPPGERWTDSELLEKGTATVLQPDALHPGEARIGIRAPVHLPDPVGLPPLPSEGGARQVRRARLLRADFAAHGFTLGCPGCDNIRGGSRVAVGHSERCRDRMQAILAQSDGAGSRRMEEAARRAARAGAGAPGGGPEQDPKRRRVGEGAEDRPAEERTDEMEVDPGEDRGGADATRPPSPPSASSSPSVSTNEQGSAPSGAWPKREIGEGAEPAAKRLRGDDGSAEIDGGDFELMMIWSEEDGPRGAICEVYSPPRVTVAARRMGEVPGWSLDLTTADSQGRAWDFDDPACRRRAVELLERSRPFLLVGSPMCTWFSTLMSLNFPRMKPDDVRLGLERARRHLAFTFYLYGRQLRGGRHFLHEHPAGASSWKEPCVVDFIKGHRGLYTTVSNMCRFGMTSTLADRQTLAPVAKPTRWLTSSRCVAERLNLRCLGGHQHATLISGRARAAQVYPPALCEAIVRGAADERENEEKGADRPSTRARAQLTHISSLAPVFNLELLNVDPEDDGNLEEELDDDFEEEEWEAEDDVKGGELPPLLVYRARQKEINYLHQRKVYGYSTVSEALQVTGRPPLKLKWIDTNKGGRDDPEVRSRLVCTEVRRKDQVPIFSATPPLETLRVLVARLASEDPQGRSDPLKAIHIDVSRAHFYADAVRDVYIEVPREDPRSAEPGVCGKLLKTMYGTLDAAEQWGEHYSRTLADSGCTQGQASPCHFLYERLGLWVLVHGDDFFGVARSAGRQFLVKTLEAKYEIKVKEAGPMDSDAKEMKILGRILSFRPDGVTLEADPCQAEQAVDDLGLRSAKGVATPGVPETAPGPADLPRRRREAVWREEEAPVDDMDELDDPRLVGERFTLYQSVAARLNYYALDRPDLQYAVKELMRKMGCPTENDLARLKRVGRYLLSAPRVVMHYPWTALSDTLRVFTDSDHAGCHRTRKSTAGGVILWGGGVVKTWSKTLPVIALSSGESELAACVRAAAEGIGLQTVLADFGFKARITIESDATAAIGMCRRLGLGKVRHLATADLWIQQRVRMGQFTLKKLPGKVNPSDLLTKHLSRPDIERLLELMRVIPLPGRATSAPLRVSPASPNGLTA